MNDSIPSQPGAAPGLRRLLGKFSHSPTGRHYSTEEVRRCLHATHCTDERTAAVHAAAARTGLWSGLMSDKLTRELGPAGRRLPTVVYWYRQGTSAHEIGRRLSPFGSAWDAERALTVAAALIAHVLNHGD